MLQTQINNTGEEVRLTDGTRELFLRVGQSIDYKGAADAKASVGKIIAVKYAGGDGTSAWMQVADMGNAAETEWISCAVWYAQFGAAPVIVDEPLKQTENGSTEPETSEDYPF